MKILRSRLIRLGFIKYPDQVWIIAHVFLRFPTGSCQNLSIRPGHQVEETRAFTAAVDFTVEYLLHLIFIRVIKLQRGQRVFNTVGDSTGTGGLKKGDVEDWVYAFESKREPQLCCMGGHHFHNQKRAEVMVVQLFGRATGTNVPCIKPNSVTNLKLGIGSRRPVV